jgi:hypothetical protein
MRGHKPYTRSNKARSARAEIIDSGIPSASMQSPPFTVQYDLAKPARNRTRRLLPKIEKPPEYQEVFTTHINPTLDRGHLLVELWQCAS